MIALIPCRTGSKRIPRKNFRELGGRPVWQWTYDAAHESGVFGAVVLCTDAGPADFKPYPAGAVLHQPHPLHRDDCRDHEWVTDALKRVPCEEFAILRPTSPFRDAACIKRAKEQWDRIKENYDSMRAITPTKQHPMKQWSYDPDTHEMWALMKAAHHKHMHSRPTQTLGDFYAQTAGLEMAWSRTPLELGTIAGDKIAGFLVEGREALDINHPEDFEYAEYLESHRCH